MRSFTACTLLLTACATLAEPGGPVTGQWGGQHIGMTATAVAVSFDFDCAAGRIDSPLLPASNGRFSQSGVYFRGHGGPERVDEIPRAIPAVYAGSISGDRLNLSIQLNSGERIGPFQLRRAAMPQIFRCL